MDGVQVINKKLMWDAPESLPAMQSFLSPAVNYLASGS